MPNMHYSEQHLNTIDVDAFASADFLFHLLVLGSQLEYSMDVLETK